MDILNLDNLAKKTKTLMLGGKEYAIKDMSVQDFIEANIDAKKLQGADMVQNLEATVRHIKRSIPDMPEEVIRGLSLEHMATVVKFLNGELEKEAAAGAARVEGEGKN